MGVAFPLTLLATELALIPNVFQDAITSVRSKARRSSSSVRMTALALICLAKENAKMITKLRHAKVRTIFIITYYL
jgi:hypothetical protein